jgi:predicted Zn-dependent protease
MSRRGAELEIAERIVALAREAAGGGAQAEAFVAQTALSLTRFANSFIHQNVADVTTTARLRLHLDGRTAAGSTTVVSPDGLRDLVGRTIAAARVCPPDPGWPGLTPPAPLHGDGNWDEATVHASPGDRAELVRDFVDAAGGLETAGYCRTTHWAGAFANSAGQSVAGQTTEAAMDAIARSQRCDGVARLASGRLADLDGATLGARAAAKATAAAAGQVELPPGRYEVVLEPGAVSDILQLLSAYGFNGKAYAERRSFAEPGAQQFDRAVTLMDDPLGHGRVGPPFDAEGTPKRRLTLVEDGVTAAVTHDRRTAAETGAESTGHAMPGGAALGPFPLNLCLGPARSMDGGGSTPARAGGAGPASAVDPAAAPLLSGVERGLLVTDLWYTRVLDPKSLVVTGLTRNGVWLVENGEITTPVSNLRFTQSYPQALAPGAVLSVGDEATMLPGIWGTSWWTARPLRLGSWNFTGGASG